MLELCYMENLNALSDGIFTLSGVIIGAIFTFLTQMFINYFTSKNDRNKQLREQKLEIYPKALKYIVAYEQIDKTINDTNAEAKYRMEKMCEEATLHDDFFFKFEAVAPKEVVDKFIELRNDIHHNKISSEDAHKILQQVLRNDLNDNTKNKKCRKIKVICCDCCKDDACDKYY